jgi:predicted TPR repeat methyltransferase
MAAKSMSTLYTDLSEIYEGMYQTFIDYEEEFAFYSGLLNKYQCQSALEAGCGTGNLASRFAAVGVDYTGMDLSEAMLAMARRNNPLANFLKADMRNFHLLKPKQSCMIAADPSVIWLRMRMLIIPFTPFTGT